MIRLERKVLPYATLTVFLFGESRRRCRTYSTVEKQVQSCFQDFGIDLVQSIGSCDILEFCSIVDLNGYIAAVIT